MSDFDNTVETIDDNAGNVIQGALSKAALEYIVTSIVDDKESVAIDFEEAGRTVTLRVHVGPEDKGKIIGRRGRVAMALRTVTRAIGSRENVNVVVDIVD
jgi:uncharacterized protein